MTFETGTRVLVRQADADDWTLQEPVVYDGRTQRFVVPAGTRTDFASVPRVFAWLVPKYGRFTAAAVLHDHLVRVERPAGRIDAEDADGLFRRAMRELGVAFLLRWFMWGAVRLGSLANRDGRPGWLHDAPKVLAVTILALPVIVLPAVTILLGLGVFAVLEYATWALLLAARRLQPADDHEINRPEPDLRT